MEELIVAGFMAGRSYAQFYPRPSSPIIQRRHKLVVYLPRLLLPSTGYQGPTPNPVMTETYLDFQEQVISNLMSYHG